MSIAHVRRLALDQVSVGFIGVRKTSVFLGQEFRRNEHIQKKAQPGGAYTKRDGKLLGSHRTRLQRREQVELYTREHSEPSIDGESQFIYGFRFRIYVCHGLTSVERTSLQVVRDCQGPMFAAVGSR